MKILDYFIMKRTALDGKSWWCVCYHGIDGKLHTESKHKLKRQAEYRKERLNGMDKNEQLENVFKKL